MDLDVTKVLSDLSQTKEPSSIIKNEVTKIVEHYRNKSKVSQNQLELTVNLKVESHDQFVVLSNNSLTCSLESLMYAIQENLITTVRILMKQDEELRNKLDSNKNTPIHFALKLGREAIAELLIESPANLELNDSERNTLLHLAAQSNLYKTFENLKHRYDETKIFEKNMHNDNCIHLALKNGSNEIFMFIHQLGIINYATLGSNNNTYLHCAAIGDCDEKVLNILIANTIDINCLNLFGRTPLHEALLNGSTRVAGQLCDYGSDINLVGINNENCFHFAAQGDCYKMIDILSERSERLSINTKSSLGSTPLHVALGESATNTIEKLIEKNADLKSLDLQGNSIFHYMAKNNLRDLIKHLDSTSPLLCQQNKSGYTPLHLSIKNNSYPVFLIFIEHGRSNIDSYCLKTKNTALHTAAILGKFSYVYGLLLNGANPDAKNEDGNTPIQLALKHKNLACVEILLLYATNIHRHFCKKGYGVMHYATNCSVDIIIKIIEANNKCTLDILNKETNDTLYHSAIQNNNLEVIEFLVSQNVNQTKNHYGVTPLHMAGISGNAKILETLLDQLNIEDIKAKDYTGKSVLEHIVLSGNKESLDKLEKRLAVLENPLDLSQLKNKNILHGAVKKGRLDMIHTLLSNEVLKDEIDKLDKNGWAPLHYAARFGNMEAIECLVSFGCNKDIITKENFKTPLHVAACNNKIEIVKYLIQIGVKIDFRDKRGYTAMHFAIIHRHKDIVIYLIQAHASTALVTHARNHTPLLHATALNRVNLMEYLIACDENMFTTFNYITEDLKKKAIHSGSLDALEFIENYEGPNYNIIKLLSKDVKEIL